MRHREHFDAASSSRSDSKLVKVSDSDSKLVKVSDSDSKLKEVLILIRSW